MIIFRLHKDIKMPAGPYCYNKVQWPASASSNSVTSYNFTGSTALACFISSSSAGSPAHLVDSDGGTNTFVNCTIKDMHVTGGTWSTTGCTNVSGNDGWIFPSGYRHLGRKSYRMTGRTLANAPLSFLRGLKK
jgi:hypothetical protein